MCFDSFICIVSSAQGCRCYLAVKSAADRKGQLYSDYGYCYFVTLCHFVFVCMSVIVCLVHIFSPVKSIGLLLRNTTILTVVFHPVVVIISPPASNKHHSNCISHQALQI